MAVAVKTYQLSLPGFVEQEQPLVEGYGSLPYLTT